ncbi:penicillin-binding protein 2 [Microlunatus panaciterrae]|uniref:peptidoglycan D,D-transpeptidase FtsI family protein n=1 Tax=Microlunatus panaciterrae TaxID=400768 RepID=UPI00337972EB
MGDSGRRLRMVMLALAIAVSLCAGRLVQLQGFDSSALAATSASQLTRTLPLLPSRGDITDRNGEVLAATEPAVAITADPVHTAPHAAEITTVLLKYLELDRTKTMAALTKPNTRFVYVAKKVPAATYTKIAAELTDLDLYGIFRESDPIRTYPAGAVGSNIVGFVGADGQGLAGLEYGRNTELAGVEGKEVYESAPNGSKIPLGSSVVTPATNGVNYQLTLDSELQWVAQRRLAAQVTESKADTGTAIVMNVKTGEVLAMANYPTFDSNKPGKADAEDRGNRAVSAAYEPGSVEKVLTMAALMDSGVAKPDTKVLVPGRVSSGGGYIKDYFSHGDLQLRLRGVVSKSSNIGTVLLARQGDKATLHDYLARFGLGAKTGIELPGEAAGHLPGPDMKDYTRDQISFGQGLSVTAIQEAAAISGIINGGVYHQPTILKSASDSTGASVPLDRAAPRRVVSAETSAKVRDVMEAVVVNDSTHKLAIDRYRTGGKTGTAERVNSSCGCYRGYTVSYVGFAPADNPEIMTYVVVDNPRAGDTGSGVAGPVYHDVMEFALSRYSVLPSTRKAPEKPIEW